MKKITLLFFSCVASCLSLTAQNSTFLKAYSSGGSILWRYAQPVTNGYIYVGTVGSDLVWAKADTGGNITACKKYTSTIGFTGTSGNSTILVFTSLPGNEILVTCPYKNGMSLMKINSNGGVVWSTYYKLPVYNNIELKNVAIANTAKGFWLCGDGHIGKVVTAFIINADSAGSVIQSKNVVIDTNATATNSIGGLSKMGYIVQGGDNSCYIDLEWYKNLSGCACDIPYQVGSVIVKTDSVLNKKWVKNGPGVTTTGMTVSGNKLSVLTSYTIVSPPPGPGTEYYNGLFSYDTACSSYSHLQIDAGGPPGSLGLQSLTSGGFMLYGGYANGLFSGLVLKINNANKVQWAKKYSLLKNINNSEEHLISLMPTSDNGFLITGLIDYNYIPTSAYVIKTDSNGSGTCYDNTFTPSVTSYGPQSNTSIDSVTFSPLTVIDSIVTITSFAIADTMVTYCYNNILTGISNVSEDKPEVKVFPNPNHGLFNLQLGITNYESGVVEVYSMLGEKVYSKQFSTFNPQLSVDISNQSPGIYLYRVLSENDNIIATGKVAVQ